MNAPDNIELRRDLVYGQGGGRDLKLDLFLPAAGAGLRPGIVFIHGGGWSGGSRGQFCPQAAHLAGRGYVGACIEYRLSGEAIFPAALEDAKCAVRWMRAHATDLRIDVDRIAACGGSAGGHLAAMLGLTDETLGLEGQGGHGGFSSQVNLVIDCNGVSDMVELTTRERTLAIATDFLGGSLAEKPEVYRLASPIEHVRRGAPPFLLLHGTSDSTVPYSHTNRLLEQLDAVGAPTELFAAEGAEHGFFNQDPWFEPTLERMERFLAAHFRQ